MPVRQTNLRVIESTFGQRLTYRSRLEFTVARYKRSGHSTNSVQVKALLSRFDNVTKIINDIGSADIGIA